MKYPPKVTQVRQGVPLQQMVAGTYYECIKSLPGSGFVVGCAYLAVRNLSDEDGRIALIDDYGDTRLIVGRMTFVPYKEK